MDALQAELQCQCGLHLHQSFLDAAAAAVPGGLAGLPLEQQVQHVLARFLVADMNAAGSGCLPADIQVTERRLASLYYFDKNLVHAPERLSKRRRGTSARWPAASCCRSTRCATWLRQQSRGAPCCACRTLSQALARSRLAAPRQV